MGTSWFLILHQRSAKSLVLLQDILSLLARCEHLIDLWFPHIRRTRWPHCLGPGTAGLPLIKSVLVLQKRAIRLIYIYVYFAPLESPAIPLFLSSTCLPVTLLYFKSVSTLMHDVFNNLSPCNMSNHFNSASEKLTYNTRYFSVDNLFTKYPRLSHQINSLSRRGAMIWNSIPPDLRILPRSCFKNKMREYLITSNSQTGGWLC